MQIQQPDAPQRQSASRQTTTIDPSRSSLVTLGTDILAQIVDLLQATSPASARAFARVCALLHANAQPSLHRSLALHVGPPSPTRTHTAACLRRIASRALLPSIRALRLVGGIPHDTATLATLCGLLPLMTGLRELRYPQPLLPPELLAALHAPSCPPLLGLHLPYWCFGRYRGGGPESLVQMAGSPRLGSLDVKVEYTTEEQCRDSTRDVKRVLLSCPNLQSLTLNVGLGMHGCTRFAQPTEYCGFGFVDSERPPALTALNIVEYPFYGEGLMNGSEYRPGPSFSGHSREVAYWRDTFDWSRLTRLSTSSANFALQLLPKLTALEEVSIGRIRDGGSIAPFLQDVPSVLRSISIPEWRDAHGIVDAVARHGDSLRTFHVHRQGGSREPWNDRAVNAQQLWELRRACPRLQELGIDLCRGDDWPWEALDALASFPCLRQLDVWFELRLGQEGEAREPVMTFQAAARLFA
ncbi:hypothetical protein LTR53_014145 [Teratosphaeriaceae sp. CCFEE 6253]|nr:hypothetical protein LTR53_014145 [Teratosphaeriaceae sp. CCFEE 6253]